MWFDRADGDIFAVLGRIAAVERRAAVDDGVSALPRPRPLLAEGDRNASPKYATATIDLTRTGHAGQQVVTHKAFTHFIFGADGVEHKAIYLDSATCMPLAITVHAGKTEKSATLDFSCTEVHASN